jgi:hypothetical protein
LPDWFGKDKTILSIFVPKHLYNMSEHPHRSKYKIQLTLGFILLLAFVTLMFISLFERPLIERQLLGSWYVLAGAAWILLCGAGYFISSATVHKVKSDLSRKTRRKESKNDTTSDD